MVAMNRNVDPTSSLQPRRRASSRRPLKALNVVQWVRHVPRGAQLFNQGEAAEGAFLVSRGRIRLLMSSATGQSREVATAQAGDLVGLSAAVGGRAHQCAAEAITPCTVGFIRRDDLLRLLRDESEVCFYLLQCLAADISAAYTALRELAAANHARHAHTATPAQ
jgi:CRP/FNR family transcriptional regulator